MQDSSAANHRLMAHLKAVAACVALSEITQGRWLGTSAELYSVARLVEAAARHARWAEMATAA